MKIVTDTSIIIAVLTNEKHKRKIITLTENANLIAPTSLKWEIGNAFSCMFKRKKITLNQARKVLLYYNEIPIRFIDIDLVPAIEIANKYNIYACDAYFIACSQSEHAPLMTLDKELLNISKQAAIKTIEV